MVVKTLFDSQFANIRTNVSAFGSQAVNSNEQTGGLYNEI